MLIREAMDRESGGEMSKVVNTYCIHCDREVAAPIESEKETLMVRGEPVTYEAEMLRCPQCGTAISDGVIENENLKRAYMAYGHTHDIPLPNEIADLRAQYGLSLREFSKFLGFGEQTVARYERGALPDEAHAYALRQAQTAVGAQTLLDTNCKRLSEPSIQKIERFLERKRKGEIAYAAVVLPWPWEDAFPTVPCRANGYRVFDFDRVAALAQMLAEKCTDLYKTKFQKAMFFCDMLACEQLGRSLTGLRYAHADHGPIIDGKDAVTFRLERDGVLRPMEKGWGEVWLPTETVVKADFSDDELKVIDRVVSFVNSFASANAISNVSHSLHAWQSTKNGERIDYNMTPGEIEQAIRMK